MSDAKPIGIGPYLLGFGALLFLAACVVAGAVVYALPKLGTVKPSPTPTANLAALVPDATARGQLSAFFGDFAAVVGSTTKPLKTTGQFRDAYRLAVPTFKQTGKLPDLKPFDEAVSQRLVSAIGKDDNALDGEPPIRSNLAATLQAIAEELR
jgi:hypothetical protein